MTVCPELDLANHFRFIVMYDDGSEDVLLYQRRPSTKV